MWSAPTKAPSSVPSTHTGWFMTACNSSFRDTSVLGKQLYHQNILTPKPIITNYKMKSLNKTFPSVLKKLSTASPRTGLSSSSVGRYSLDMGTVCLPKVSCAEGLFPVWGCGVLSGRALEEVCSSFWVLLFQEIMNVFTRVKTERDPGK